MLSRFPRVRPTTTARQGTLEAGLGAYLSACHTKTLYKITSVKEYGTEFSQLSQDLECFEGALSTVLTEGHPQVHWLAPAVGGSMPCGSR